MPPKKKTELVIGLTIKQALLVLGIIAGGIAGYYKLLYDIKEAAQLPAAEITRQEYIMKFNYQGDMMLRIENDVEELEDRIRDLERQ